MISLPSRLDENMGRLRWGLPPKIKLVIGQAPPDNP